MAKLIEFEKGLVEYDIGGALTVRFNPTDEGFIAKIEDTFASLDGLQERLAEDGSFSQFGELDAQMRAKVDGLLGDGAADALFEGMNCFAIADGLPVWLNLMLALMDEVSDACEREFGRTDARFGEHKAKYQKMMAKYRAGGGR